MTAKNREIFFMFLCSYVFFKPRRTAKLWGLMTAKNREIILCSYVLMSFLNREEPRNYFYVLMFLCLFLKPRITRMWQIFENSKIRDNNRDNREYPEIYVLMFLCLLKPRRPRKNYKL